MTPAKGVARLRRLIAHATAQVRSAGLATALAAVLVGGAVASAPVFLDRASGGLITAEVSYAGLDRRPALSLSTSVSGFRANPTWVADAGDALAAALEGSPSLGPPLLTVIGDEVTVTVDGQATLTAPVIGRDAAGANLDLVDGHEHSTDGIWLAEQHAGELGIGPGDRLRVVSAPVPFDVHVAGVHADVLASPSAATREYWRPVSGLLRPARPAVGGDPGQAVAQRPALLAEPGTALALTRGVLGDAVVRWESTLASGQLSLGEARRLREHVEALQEAVVARDDPLGSALGRLGPPPVLSSPVLAAVDRAVDSLALASGGVRSLQIGGGVLSLGVLAALLLVRVHGQATAIRRDLALGLPPARIAWSMTWPLLPVLAAGVAAGAALTAVAGGASAEGVRAAAVHCAVAAMLAAAASWAVGVAGVLQVQGPQRRVHARALAWDLPLLALAAAAGYQLVLRGSAVVDVPDGGLRLDLLVLAFPLLALGAAAGLLVRAVRRLLPRLRQHGAGLPVAAFLALRRIAHPRGSALVLLGFAMAAIGLASYGGVLATSAEATELAKARTRLGSDVVVPVPRDARLGPLPDGATLVGRATGRLSGRVEQVHVMAIDPDSFLSAAVWHREFAAVGIDTLLERLREPAVDGVPAVLVGVPDDGPVSLLLGRRDVRLRPVGTARDVPGRSGTAPVVVVSTERLAESLGLRHPGAPGDHLAGTELWVAGDRAAVEAIVAPGVARTLAVRTLDEVRSEPALQALGWTLGYLQAVGALAVLLALGAAVSRTVALGGQQATAAVMGERLGLRPATLARAATLELGALLAAAAVAGWLAGFGVAAIVVPLLDPLPALPPAPAVRVSAGGIAAVIVAAALATCLGGVAARLHARRLHATEHLRAGA